MMGRCGCSSRSSRPPRRWPSSPPRSARSATQRECAGPVPSSGTSRWRSWPRSMTHAGRARRGPRAGGTPVRAAHTGPGGQGSFRRAGAVDAGGRRAGGAAAARRRGPGRGASLRAADRRGSYRPRLTLARGGRPVPDLALLAAALSGFAGRSWSASDVHLVRSVLGAGPGGTAWHETVATQDGAGRAPRWPRARDAARTVVPAIRGRRLG
jgi:2'-5' RNA ligase